ncbi:hypothetical protein ASPBRDRAFT_672065 [Aspergillus brasiliensis CBS 101740]|uniref:Uncharacterized protein n=1 Tax=Aspergillus brasiliensis (strain CBS 101740 / IMI 381727 / IBT 21946) TaxID=767769 RepID=A0A1L9U1J0_ASPBC|nr:hypothetical protein ASPBRDRAFT_672065 [Aspergillus brasiliensis CBS 101740]
MNQKKPLYLPNRHSSGWKAIVSHRDQCSLTAIAPLFDFALQELESCYRFCFRSLPVDLAQYHTFCETYDFLGVDGLVGQTIDHVFVDLRACKIDYEVENKSHHAIKGDKALARDAAFRLFFLIPAGELGDEAKDNAKAYNAVLFIVSHPGTIKYRTKAILCATSEERFVVSHKQRARLDQWNKKPQRANYMMIRRPRIAQSHTIPTIPDSTSAIGTWGSLLMMSRLIRIASLGSLHDVENLKALQTRAAGTYSDSMPDVDSIRYNHIMLPPYYPSFHPFLSDIYRTEVKVQEPQIGPKVIDRDMD